MWHLPNLTRMFWRLTTDRRVPRYLKLLPIVGVVYFVAPLDLIPDFPLVGLGWLDDIVVLYVTLLLFKRLCPQDVVGAHLARIKEGR